MDDKQFLTEDEIVAKKILQKVEHNRTLLINAIKMQALYSGGKITLVETSHAIN